jgi:anti-anti-sigma factor
MSGREPTVLHLVGELDLGSCEELATRLSNALSLGRPLVVDVGDCTFADVGALRVLADAARRARERSVAFVVVLPYGSSAVLRRLVLELAPELATFPIAPSRRAGLGTVERLAVTGMHASPPVDAGRLRELRASVWENASRVEELMARRDALLLETREAMERARARRASA